MQFQTTSLPGLWLIELDLREDERGFFTRTFCEQEFARHGLHTRWPQGNYTVTQKLGALRGMHFQAAPRPEIKLVRCVTGRIFDVLLDVRRDSPTFGQWEGFELSADRPRQLYVPAGLAHGFQCLEDHCGVAYQMSEFFVPELARGIRWNDPFFQVRWPHEPVVMSPKDRQLPDFDPSRDAQ